MGVHRHWLGDALSISLFRKEYEVPATVEIRPDGPDDGFTYSDGWMPFWLVAVVEGGVRFPLHPLLRECLREWGLSPCQLLPNEYKIIMGTVRLNEVLSINLGVSDIEEAYDLCKSAEGHTYYLRLRIHRTAFVTALEDSYKYAGEDRVFVRGAWEFGEAEPSTTARIPRKIGVPPSFRQRRELARRNRWRVNSDWHEKVRKYRGHHCRAAYSLLGYTPHYKSFLAPRRVTGIDSVLRGEDTGPGTDPTQALVPETVTVAIPSGLPVESGRQSPVRERGATKKAETGRRRQRQKFVVSSESRSTSSSEESEVDMLRGRRKRFVAEDLAAAAFGGMGETSVPSLGAVVNQSTSATDATEVSAPETETVPEATDGAQSGTPAAAEVGTSTPATVFEESHSDPGRGDAAEVVEERRSEKRPRVEAPSATEPAMSVGGSAAPSDFIPWRPDIKGVLGRELAESDRAVSPEVVVALGRSCALPQDMARWAQMDNKSLLMSSMRSLVTVLQKCQTGMGRLDAAEARAADWATEKEELLKSLAARDAALEEEARTKEDLLAELDAERALAEHLKEEAKQAVDQNVQLSWKLDEVRLASSRREEDMKMLRGTNSRLISERKLAERKLEMALDGKAAELARALRDQEARLKEEYVAEHESVMNEEVSKLAADYKAQLPGIREKAWALGWKAALRRVGVPPDSPIFQNSPRFPRSDSELRAVSGIAPAPSASEVPPATVVPAPPVVPEAAPAVPGESAAGTSCNEGAAAP
ncbi:hypothetical protein AAC387_Pa11g2042 [Persea americana]